MAPKIKLKPGQPFEIRPLIAAVMDINNYHPHTSTDLNVGDLHTINVPSGVRSLLVQAVDQNIRYVISGEEVNPSQTSGFVLTAGNDPLAISVLAGQVIVFTAGAAGARLEMQYCQ